MAASAVMSVEEPTWDDPDFAQWYIEHLATGSAVHATAVACLLELLPPLDGSRVLDVACGEGLVARAVAERGASVVGIDISERLVDEACRREADHPLRIAYHVGDAENLQSLGSRTFDGVTCGFGVMNFADLNAVFLSVRRVLRPGGWFAFTLTHPCFEPPFAEWTTRDGVLARVVNGYFNERFWRATDASQVRRVGNYHRTLSTYVNALVCSGHTVQRILEPGPDSAIAQVAAGYRQVAIMLGVLSRVPS